VVINFSDELKKVVIKLKNINKHFPEMVLKPKKVDLKALNIDLMPF
jgi:hypothetical protein